MTSRAWAIVILVSVGCLLAVPVLCLHGTYGTSTKMRHRVEDLNNLRMMGSLVAQERKLPMKDGAFDPYDFVRRGLITGDNLRILRSARSGTGPTKEEIERGDYTNFPWERYRGDGTLRGPPIPLLWDKKPDKHGRLLVGLSDGSARECENSDFKLRRIAGAVTGSSEIPVRDGAFDPYALFRDGKIARSDLVLVCYDGSEVGPTDAEIARGDYTNFAWDRYRGDGKIEGPPVPVLWDKPLDDHALILLAFSDGSLKYLDRADAQAALHSARQR